jgi:hypothetical protein
MSVEHSKQEQGSTAWRLKLGVAILVLSIILPLAVVPAIMALDLSASITASVSGALLIGAEVFGIIAVAVMGKPGYLLIKNRVFGFFRKHGPPQQVSRRRYNIGLVMFCIPILFALVSGYAAEFIPGFTGNPLPYAITGDLLLIASLFVLGGDFWDKLKGLFVYSDRICQPQPAGRERRG